MFLYGGSKACLQPYSDFRDYTWDRERDDEKGLSSKCPYRPLAGSLLYIANACPPDIAYAVNCRILANYTGRLQKESWHICWQSLIFASALPQLQKTSSTGIPMQTMLGMSPCAHVPVVLLMASSTLGDNVVNWSSKLRPPVSLSTCMWGSIKTYYILMQLLTHIKVVANDHPIPVRCDNASTVKR